MNSLSWELNLKFSSFGYENAGFDTKSTLQYPTKTSIMGMIKAGLGINKYKECPNHKFFEDLKFGYIVKNRGIVNTDLQNWSANDVHCFKKKKEFVTKQTEKYFLEDHNSVIFVFHNDISFLEHIQNGLQNPVYPLYCGRKQYWINKLDILLIKNIECFERAILYYIKKDDIIQRIGCDLDVITTTLNMDTNIKKDGPKIISLKESFHNEDKFVLSDHIIYKNREEKWCEDVFINTQL